MIFLYSAINNWKRYFGVILNICRCSHNPYFRNLPLYERIVACFNILFFHSISTLKPPLARIPISFPFAHAVGKAGKISIYPIWLCNSISAKPPKGVLYITGYLVTNAARVLSTLSKLAHIPNLSGWYHWIFTVPMIFGRRWVGCHSLKSSDHSSSWPCDPIWKVSSLGIVFSSDEDKEVTRKPFLIFTKKFNLSILRHYQDTSLQ